MFSALVASAGNDSQRSENEPCDSYLFFLSAALSPGDGQVQRRRQPVHQRLLEERLARPMQLSGAQVRSQTQSGKLCVVGEFGAVQCCISLIVPLDQV